MAAPRPGMFRQKSLERLSSPERLDQLVQLVDRRSWLPLTALAAVIGVALLWSIFGKVPINVHGEGILVHPRAVREIHSPGSGRLVQLDVAVGDAVGAGQTIGRIALPELEKQLELQREKVLELTALSGAADLVGPRESGVRTSPGSLEGHLEAARSVAARLRTEALDSIVEERRILERQLERARALAAALEGQWQSQREMEESGYASEVEVLDAESDYLDGQMRLSGIETRLLDLKTREIEIEDRYLSRVQGLADVRMDLQDYEQQVADAHRQILTLEARLGQEGRIVSENAGTMLEIHSTSGQFVTVGDRVGTMSVGSAASPLDSIVYFTVGDGKRIKPGNLIQVTPDTVERERFGGIKGVVLSVSTLAVTVDEAANLIGNREIAEDIVGRGYRIQVVAKLHRDEDTPSGLKWTSSRGPDEPISPGLTTTARVAVEERRPIAFVVPALKSTAGVD